MNESYGFIITRHVNSEKTNKYWNQCVKLIRTFYPHRKIVIIDDNSNYNYVKEEFNYQNVQFIQSEFPGRGELLPYYYYLKYKFFKNAVIIHDSVFFHRRIHFELLNGVKVLPLWFFHPDTENINNTTRISSHLNHYQSISPKLSKDITLLGLSHDKWIGCFGVQCYIHLPFLEYIEHKYKITRLIQCVKCRADRCCLERIFGCIFSTESPTLYKKKSLLGNIMKYYKWGYSYGEYVNDLKRGIVPKAVVKVWTGR